MLLLVEEIDSHISSIDLRSISASHWLVQKHGDYLPPLNFKSWLIYFEYIPINLNSRIHSDIVGITWRIRNDLIPVGYRFAHEEIVELIRQEFSK